MIHAYQEIYLNNAQAVLGEAFDYAINTCNILGNNFVKMFLVSSVSKKMERGEPKYIAGKSGIEVAREIVFETMGKDFENAPAENFGRSKEYWIGWALAYYHWYSSRKYSDILKAVSYEELEQLYYALHEADISKFVDVINQRWEDVFPETNLKRIRTAYGITQAELAKICGVSIRSIQMYEQKKKDINKANVETIYRIANVLGCTIEDLIEK
ncbi:MAG: helix-turn-helix domain-containing protein [Eubacteriales bacterium]